MSVLGATPGVDPHRRVNATDAGENPFALQVSFWATLLLVSPTAAFAVPTVLGAPWPPGWFVLAVGVVNGVVAGHLLGRTAQARLAARLPETFARIRYPGSTGARTGDGLLDRLTEKADDAAAARTPAG